MSRRLRYLLIGAAVSFVGLLVYSSFQHTEHTYEVCVSYGGASHCAVSSGETPEAAITSGKTIGCTLLTGSRDDNILCLDRPPTSVRELKE